MSVVSRANVTFVGCGWGPPPRRQSSFAVHVVAVDVSTGPKVGWVVTLLGARRASSRHRAWHCTYQFILAEEVFSRLLNRAFVSRSIGAYQASRGCPLIPHFLYANDLLVFVNDAKSSLKERFEALQSYEKITS